MPCWRFASPRCALRFGQVPAVRLGDALHLVGRLRVAVDGERDLAGADQLARGRHRREPARGLLAGRRQSRAARRDPPRTASAPGPRPCARAPPPAPSAAASADRFSNEQPPSASAPQGDPRHASSVLRHALREPATAPDGRLFRRGRLHRGQEALAQPGGQRRRPERRMSTTTAMLRAGRPAARPPCPRSGSAPTSARRCSTVTRDVDVIAVAHRRQELHLDLDGGEAEARPGTPRGRAGPRGRRRSPRRPRAGS